MTSIRDRDEGRNELDFDNDRKEGRFAPGGDRGHWFETARAIVLPCDAATGATYCPACGAPEPVTVTDDGCGDCDAAMAGVDV